MIWKESNHDVSLRPPRKIEQSLTLFSHKKFGNIIFEPPNVSAMLKTQQKIAERSLKKFLYNLINRQHKEREVVAVGHRIQLGRTSSVRKFAAVGPTSPPKSTLSQAKSSQTDPKPTVNQRQSTPSQHKPIPSQPQVHHRAVGTSSVCWAPISPVAFRAGFLAILHP